MKLVSRALKYPNTDHIIFVDTGKCFLLHWVNNAFTEHVCIFVLEIHCTVLSGMGFNICLILYLFLTAVHLVYIKNVISLGWDLGWDHLVCRHTVDAKTDGDCEWRWGPATVEKHISYTDSLPWLLELLLHSTVVSLESVRSTCSGAKVKRGKQGG